MESSHTAETSMDYHIKVNGTNSISFQLHPHTPQLSKELVNLFHKHDLRNWWRWKEVSISLVL